jgi:hypothetical protein
LTGRPTYIGEPPGVTPKLSTNGVNAYRKQRGLAKVHVDLYIVLVGFALCLIY